MSKEDFRQIFNKILEYNIKHEIERIILIGADDTCELITLEEAYALDEENEQ